MLTPFSCMHFLRTTDSGGELGSGDRQSGIGYLFSGLAIAGVHAVSRLCCFGAYLS